MPTFRPPRKIDEIDKIFAANQFRERKDKKLDSYWEFWNFQSIINIFMVLIISRVGSLQPIDA